MVRLEMPCLATHERRTDTIKTPQHNEGHLDQCAACIEPTTATSESMLLCGPKTSSDDNPNPNPDWHTQNTSLELCSCAPSPS